MSPDGSGWARAAAGLRWARHVGILVADASMIGLGRIAPVGFALAVADLRGALASRSPAGRAEAKRLAKAFPHRWDIDAVVRARGAVKPRDFAISGFLLRTRGQRSPFAGRHHMTPGAERVLRSDRSFVLASAHVCTDLFLPLAPEGCFGRRMAFVVGGQPAPPGNGPTALLGRLVRRLQRESLRRSGAILLERGEPGTAKAVIRHLTSPGACAVILADADRSGPNDRSRLLRPWLGRRPLEFGSGVAGLARIAQVPILVCAPYRDGSTAVFEWSDPIEAPLRHDRNADPLVADTVLDRLEVAVGRHPECYGMPIGGYRSWSDQAGRWSEPSEN